MDQAAGEDAGAGPSKDPPRRRPSVVGILGEVLITAGVLVLLYVGWQLWIGDLIYGAQRNAAGHELSQEWEREYSAPAPSASPETVPDPAPGDPVTADPVVMPEPEDGEVFGIMHIPRFGADYQVPMAGGVSRARTLDPIGIGHYPGTRMPGEVGNFAVAAHRTTYGKPFNRIAELHVGDAIVVETADGWYTYRFRTLEYVTPDEIEVLLPVPQVEDAAPGSRYITLTSCSPLFSMAERIVAYGVFDSFTPRSAGPPPALSEEVST